MRTTWFQNEALVADRTDEAHPLILAVGWMPHIAAAMAETTRILPFNAKAIAEATRMIASGQPVAVATRRPCTDCTRMRPMQKPWRASEAKGQPDFNPLIVSCG